MSDTPNKIYLYVKTHVKTGLKYLGKTSATDPHLYKGSGKYWRRHLKKHGTDYTTEIIKECSSNDEVRYWGEYYSNLWDIVHAKNDDGKKIWANERPEIGDGGITSDIAKRGQLTKILKGNHLNWIKAAATPESREKVRQTKIKNGTIESNPAIVEKILETKRRNGTDKCSNNPGNSPEGRAKSHQTRLRNGTGPSSPEVVAKMIETKRKNGTLSTGAESARRPEVRAKISEKNSKTYKIIDPDGNEYIIKNLSKYCYTNNLPFDMIYKSRNGWSCKLFNINNEE